MKFKHLAAYDRFIKPLVLSPDIQQMDLFSQHAKGVSCLDHCLYVSYMSFVVCRWLRLNAQAAARAALMHDMCLQLPEEIPVTRWRMLKLHPKLAVHKAERHGLSELERDIILKHMWPLNFRKFPSHRESVVVNLADKICTIIEVSRLYRLLGVAYNLGQYNKKHKV